MRIIFISCIFIYLTICRLYLQYFITFTRELKWTPYHIPNMLHFSTFRAWAVDAWSGGGPGGLVEGPGADHVLEGAVGRRVTRHPTFTARKFQNFRSLVVNYYLGNLNPSKFPEAHLPLHKGNRSNKNKRITVLFITHINSDAIG